MGAPRRLGEDPARDLEKPRVEIHPNKPVEPLDANLRETRPFAEKPKIGSPFNSGTPLPQTTISGERPAMANSVAGPRGASPQHGRIVFWEPRLRKSQRKPDQIQYFGITGGPYRRRLNRWHHALGQITRNPRVWLGQIEYPDEFSRSSLELAEGCLIYFWGPKLNKKKLVTPPKPVCLISRWLRPDGEARKNRQAIYKGLPDVVWWDGEYWRTGNLKPPYPDY
jgi:hypothetical protein